MAKEMNDEDLELLGELGVEMEAVQAGGRPARESRIIAGFEEIERFVREHNRPPEHGENRDIFERIYAVRLDQIRQSVECRSVLREIDRHGLLGTETPVNPNRVKEPSDDELLAELGVAPLKSDVTKLLHVRSREEIRAAEEIAQRNPCRDFEHFRPILEKVQQDLKSGKRESLKYADNAGVTVGNLFILDGQKIIIADVGQEFVGEHGRLDRRLRVVYDNGTESDLLLRSLQRALNKDKTSRRITESNLGTLFSDIEEENDSPTGYIYVLRSKSEHPFVALNRLVIHKIGVTGGDVTRRIANAKLDPTYLLADVEIVATFKLANIDRRRLEALLHKLFAAARLDLQIADRFGNHVDPREWFLVPLPMIEEAIQRVKNGTIENCRYDLRTAKLIEE